MNIDHAIAKLVEAEIPHPPTQERIDALKPAVERASQLILLGMRRTIDGMISGDEMGDRHLGILRNHQTTLVDTFIQVKIQLHNFQYAKANGMLERAARNTTEFYWKLGYLRDTINRIMARDGFEDV